MFNSLVFLAIILALVGTVFAFARVVFRHKSTMRTLSETKNTLSETEKMYQDQTALIIRTIANTQPVFKELYDAIDDVERLARGTTASAAVRSKADEMRDMVIGLDELILVQNIEEGLRIREQFHSSGHNAP